MRTWNLLQASGFAINWGTLQVGWQGPGLHLRQLTVSDVVEAAFDKLSGAKPDERPLIHELIALRNDEEQQVGEFLSRLAAREGSPPSLEERKWRLVMLKEALAVLPSDPVDALIHLSDFWSTFDYPPDSPHVHQGVGNELTPSEYYTAETLERLLQNHRTWIEREIQALGGSNEGSSSFAAFGHVPPCTNGKSPDLELLG